MIKSHKFFATFQKHIFAYKILKAERNIVHIINCFTFLSILIISSSKVAFAQKNITTSNDSNTPLHLIQPDYPIPYGVVKQEDIAKLLNRIYAYLNEVTPAEFVNGRTKEIVSDLSKIDENTALKKGDFRLVSYEWGVIYGAMLQAARVTGDAKFREYTEKRLKFIAEAIPYFKKISEEHSDWGTQGPLKGLLNPRSLDDCGAMCVAMIKASREGGNNDYRTLINSYIDFILQKEFRLKDGTLARNRPQKNTLWLDDLYMGMPAIAQMGKLTGDKKYFDEAVKQVLQFSSRMFNAEKGVYMHGWAEGMTEHPQFHWARANGWGILAIVELLDVLPESHLDRAKILDLFRRHAKGLASYQSGSGFWHQLLDRNDSYLETSATAMYAYCFAKGVNEGWLDPVAYAPVAMLAWNAISAKVNEFGQVEGTCVGTGMAFDPAFYYHRPVSPFAAHGYGPVILAGSEIIKLLKYNQLEINDSSIQLKAKKL